MTATVSAEDKNQAKLGHILNGFFPLIGGLIIWLMGKDKSKFIDDQGKEMVNWGITIAFGYVVAAILSFVAIGLLLYPVLWIGAIIFGFIAGGKAGAGEKYRYPFAVRLIK